ncbi:hypothetical protein LTR17_007449 [Elasticomyces elasticus]|nr:hypothetical protein LTR17_007449 [Elasticomyces elasticus]
MDQTRELLEMPRVFLKDGRQFITRCSKPDRREFLRISQAVGMGFLIMGVIGYVVKLSECHQIRAEIPGKEGDEAVGSGQELRAQANKVIVHIPVNNILVGGA